MSWLLGATAALASPLSGPGVDIAAAGPKGALKGTIIADGDAARPVVLILPGSGPTDRDGNNVLGVKAATYRLLAEGLAARGIASVRIDKRGLFASAGAVADPNDVTLDDYVADTRSWIAATRQSTGAPCVWLLGHSEGGLIALATTAADHEHICGMILAASPGRRLGETLKEQLRAIPAYAPFLDAADRAIDMLSAGRHVDAATLPPALGATLFRSQIQGLLISELTADPAALIARADRPVLILQGQRDLQAGVADARRLAGADAAARLVLLPDANHVLKAVASDDRQANLATYAAPDLPLAPGVVDAVAHFIEQAERR